MTDEELITHGFNAAKTAAEDFGAGDGFSQLWADHMRTSLEATLAADRLEAALPSGVRVRVEDYEELEYLAKTYAQEATVEHPAHLRQLYKRRAGLLGRILSAIEPTQAPEGDHGWVCYNGGPGTMFWNPTREDCEHELSDDIRPATSLEKALFQRFGKPCPNGGFEFDPTQAPQETDECETCTGTGTVEDPAQPLAQGGFKPCPDCAPAPAELEVVATEHKAGKWDETTYSKGHVSNLIGYTSSPLVRLADAQAALTSLRAERERLEREVESSRLHFTMQQDDLRHFMSAAEAAEARVAELEKGRKFKLRDRVMKAKGSSWTGHVVGFYSTSLTPVGYAVESEREPGSVQIYPEAALVGLRADETIKLAHP